jgi:hypothetical protein
MYELPKLKFEQKGITGTTYFTIDAVGTTCDKPNINISASFSPATGFGKNTKTAIISIAPEHLEEVIKFLTDTNNNWQNIRTEYFKDRGQGV